jgi:hypothetical protein
LKSATTEATKLFRQRRDPTGPLSGREDAGTQIRARLQPDRHPNRSTFPSPALAPMPHSFGSPSQLNASGTSSYEMTNASPALWDVGIVALGLPSHGAETNPRDNAEGALVRTAIGALFGRSIVGGEAQEHAARARVREKGRRDPLRSNRRCSRKNARPILMRGPYCVAGARSTRCESACRSAPLRPFLVLDCRPLSGCFRSQPVDD